MSQSIQFHVVLTDKNNKVLLVGDPTYFDNIKNQYIAKIQEYNNK